MYKIPSLIFAGLSLFFLSAKAQVTPEEAIRKVYETLTLEEPLLSGDTIKLLQSGAWESLSYINEADMANADMVSEAVPDYYHFLEKKAIVKLIDQQDVNAYGMELSVDYTLKSGDIYIMNTKTGEVLDRWQLLFLDENYMAMDMGEVRVFFTHTPPQE